MYGRGRGLGGGVSLCLVTFAQLNVLIAEASHFNQSAGTAGERGRGEGAVHCLLFALLELTCHI